MLNHESHWSVTGTPLVADDDDDDGVTQMMISTFLCGDDCYYDYCDVCFSLSLLLAYSCYWLQGATSDDSDPRN